MVIFGPADPILGGVLSITLIVWLTVGDWLPLQSTAFQILVREYTPGHGPGTVTSETKVTETEGSHPSVADGGLNMGIPGQEIVALGPAWPITGGVLSMMLMVWLTVGDSFPLQSRARQVIVREYRPGQLPWVVTSETRITLGLRSQLSDAVGGVNTGLAGQANDLLGPGELMEGGTLSMTWIVCVTTGDSSPLQSTAFHFLVRV